MTENKKNSIKKTFRDYAAAIVATAMLLITLALLLVFRHSALVSVNDLSKINPLITSADSELVSVNGSGELIETPKGDLPNDDKQTTDDKKVTSNQGKQTGKPQGSKSGGQGTIVIEDPDNPGETPSNPNPSDEDSSQPRFTVTIDSPISPSVNSRCTIVDLLGICVGTYTYTYTISASILSKNGPGGVAYTWRVKPTNGNEVVYSSSYTAGNGTSSKVVSQSWTSAQCKAYDISLTITQPNNQEKATLQYIPNC